MSSLLRPTKFVQLLARASKSRVVLPSSRNLRYIALINGETKTFVRWNHAYSAQQKNNLQPLLARLDEEVRRFGRITKKDIQELLIGVRTYDFTSAQSLLVIRCCGELVPEELPEKRTQLVQQVWAALNDRNIPLDISHYNALLRVYIENEHPFSPAEFLEELSSKGLQPNRVTYQRLMWRYCAIGDVEGATRILERMRELGLPVSEPVLNALVMGHAFHGDTGGARAVLETMTGAGLQPSGRTYALLAGGHARAGDVPAAREVLKLAAERDVFLSDRDLMDVIESLAIGGRTEDIDDILGMMQNSVGYNQDATSLILRLINRGYDEAAIKVMRTLNQPKSLDGKEPSVFRGAFFVKQLVAAGRSAEQLIQLCLRLKNEDLVPAALTIATGAVLTRGDAELAKPLISEMKREGLPVRHHYYWPVLACAGRAGDERALLDTLRAMNADDLAPNLETLHSYVAPYLLAANAPDAAIAKLRDADVTPPRAARAVLLEVLGAGSAREAARLATQYRPTGYLPQLQGPLLACLASSGDVESFAIVLHAALGRRAAGDEPEDAERERRGEVGALVAAAVASLQDVAAVDRLLGALLARGVAISNRAAHRIEERVGERMTSSISDKLAALSSGSLEPGPVERVGAPPPARRPPPPALEAMLARAREAGKPTSGLVRQLVQAHAEAEDEAGLSAVVARLEADGDALPSGVLAQLIEFYSERDVDRALEYRARLLAAEPDYTLNKYKLMKLVSGLVRADRVPEALDVMKSPKIEDDKESYKFNSICWQVLNYLAENKEKKDVQTVLEAMIENGLTQPTNVLLGTLVKTHVMRDDIDGALAEIERCCDKYRCTPWKSELLRRLIESEDAARLQRLTDLSTAVHGEVNSLHDLALALVECGRLRQARRVLETPGLRARTTRLNLAANRYLQEGKTDCLEGLIEATKELSNIDRSDIFYSLLVSYCRADATDAALGLWTQLQEQDEVPTDKFLRHLAAHLRARDLPVPFAVPEPAPAEPASRTVRQNRAVEREVRAVERKTEPKAATQKSETVARPRSPLVGEILAAVEARDERTVAAKMDELERATELSRAQYSVVAESALSAGLTAAAVRACAAAHARGHPLRHRLTRAVLTRAAAEGRVQLVETFGGLLTDEQKREMRYASKLTRAHLVSGDGAAWLSRLRDDLAAAPDTETATARAAYFPRAAALAEALRDPAMEKICEEILKISLEKNVMVPLVTMWQEYLIAGDETRTRALWERLKDSGSLAFSRVVRAGREGARPELLRSLLEYMRTHAATSPAGLALVHSALLRAERDPARALEDLRACEAAGVPLSALDRGALLAARDAAAAAGLAFPYEIPAPGPVAKTARAQ